MTAIISAHGSNPVAVDVSAKIVDRPMICGSDTAKEETQWKVVAGVLSYEGRTCVPETNSLRGRVLSLFHDNSVSSHFGALKTTELVSWDFCWPAMDSRVCKYVSGCEVCHRIKAPRHTRHGINTPFETPSRPWEGITMDFVTDLPESTAWGYTRILVIVDRLTKMAIYLPCGKDIDSPELARLFFGQVICMRGAPDNIVTNCGTQFTSRFWKQAWSHLSTDHRLSTAFHPQLDGQTERQNQTMKQYLRDLCN